MTMNKVAELLIPAGEDADRWLTEGFAEE